MSDYLEILSDTSVESIDNCIICFYPLENEIAELSCGHKYHFDCLKSWANKKKNLGNLCCICNKENIEIHTVYNEGELITETNIDNSIDKSEIVNRNNIDTVFWCCNIL